MKSLITILFIFASYTGLAQSKLDSLIHQLENPILKDTTKVRLLVELAYIYKNVNPADGIKAGLSAVAISAKIKNDSLLADSWNVLGANYLYAGSNDSAIATLQRSLFLNERLQRLNAQSFVLNNIGSYYYFSADYIKALDYYRRGAATAEESGNQKQFAACSGNMGIVYTALSDFPRALMHHLKSLKIHTELETDNAIANNCHNIAMVYRYMFEFQKAIEYAERSYVISKRLGDISTQSTTLTLLAEIYLQQGKTEEAILKCRESLATIGNLNIPRSIALNHTTLGRIYSKTQNYTESLENFEKGIQILKEINDLNNMCFALQELGMVYLNAPDQVLKSKNVSPSSRYSKAIAFQEKSLSIATEIESFDRQATAYDNISIIYARQNNFDKALTYFKKATVVNDSIFTSEKKLEAARLELQYQFEKQEALTKAENDKQNALAALQMEKQRMRNRTIMGGSALLLLSGIGGFVSYKRRRDTEQKKLESDFKLQVSDTEMKALRAQMNPHFIFNSLNSISDYITRNEVKEADNYLGKFAKLMRQILENSEMKEVTLADDLVALENYMQLEALRLRNKFTWSVIIDPLIDINNTLIPPLILQPFVENSIWHGISNKNGIGEIRIYISKKEDMIHCVVEDNGVGRKMAVKESSNVQNKSFGMQITQARIDILNRLKKSSAEVSLADLAEGLRVEVKLPYLPAF